MTSALQGLTLGRALTPLRAEEALQDYADLAITRHPATLALMRRAWDLRERMSAYDASYVALAQALGAPLWTLDARLARAAGGDLEVVVPPL